MPLMHLCHLEVVVYDLLQVHHALWACGAQHGLAVDAVNPEPPLVGQRVLEVLYDRCCWRRAQRRTAYQYRVLRSLSSCPDWAAVRSRRSPTKSTRNDRSTRSRPPKP